MDIEQIWSAALGALALVSTHLAGSRRSSAWIVGMVSQIGWLGFIIFTGNLGFLVSFTGFTFVYIRNYRAWTRKPAAQTEPPQPGQPGSDTSAQSSRHNPPPAASTADYQKTWTITAQTLRLLTPVIPAVFAVGITLVIT